MNVVINCWYYFQYQSESEKGAKDYCEFKRNICPASYTKKKQNAVHHLCVLGDTQLTSDKEQENEIESKKELRLERQKRMEALNGLVFDVQDSDLEDFQEVIQTNSDDEDGVDNIDTLAMAIQPAMNTEAVAPIEESIKDAMAANSGPNNSKSAAIGPNIPDENQPAEHEQEIERILTKVKEHMPEKYTITFDEVSIIQYYL